MYKFAAASENETIVFGAARLDIVAKKSISGLSLCKVKIFSVFAVYFMKLS